MKALCTIATLILLIVFSSPVSAQEWVWVTSERPATTGTAVSHDPGRNVYVTGTFTGTTQFGDSAAVSRGGQDIFLVKYSPGGDALWVRTIGSTGTDEAMAIETDGYGNSYIAGGFRDTAWFGIVPRVSRGGEDFYFGVYDRDGNLRWMVTGGGSGFDRANAVTTDLNGDLYVTGTFSGVMTLGDTTVTGIGQSDLFVARYDATGRRKTVWHWGATGSSSEGFGISRRAFGDLFVGGSFTRSITFGSTVLVDSATTGDGFLVRIAPQGTPLWAKRIGGPQTDYVSSLIARGNHCTIAGNFRDAVRVDTVMRSSAGGTDMFVARFDTAGVVDWVQQAGGTGNDSVVAVRHDIEGNLFIAGRFDGSARFGDTTLNAGGSEIFIAKYSQTGTGVWAHQAGGKLDDAAVGMDVDDHAILVTGFYTDTARFDTITRTGGTRNFFVGKFSELRSITTPTAPDTICAGDFFTTLFLSHGVFEDGNVYTAQLSDASGSFASPIAIGMQADPDLLSIRATIPIKTPAGNRYRIRIVSSAPLRASPDNGKDITIQTASVPEVTVTGSTSFCKGTQVMLTATAGYAGYYWSTGERTRAIIITFPGDYYVIVTGENGCRAVSKTITLTELPAPDPPTIMQTGNMLQTDTGSAAYHHQWNLDGNPIDGATGSSYLATQSGAYTVTITDTNGCSATSDPLNITITSVAEDEGGRDISRYSHSIDNGLLTLRVDLQPLAMLHIRIVNLLGETVWEMKEGSTGEHRLSVDLSHMPAGPYLLSIEANGMLWRQEKIILP